jgi:hypothetical protein
MARMPLIQLWTAEDSVLLAKLLREGKDYIQISRHMKWSAAAARNRARRLAQSQAAAGRAGAEGEAMSDEIASLSFQEYLVIRRNRYSPTNTFVRDMINDEEFAIVTSREEPGAYLSRRNITPTSRMYATQCGRATSSPRSAAAVLPRRRAGNGYSPGQITSRTAVAGCVMVR